MNAIVFSGGGARGAYQIGVWKALRKLNMKFDIVTGTSVGAFNGALYVQGNFRKAYKIWWNMKSDFVFNEPIDFNNYKKTAKTYLENLVKYGGMNIDSLEGNVKKYLDIDKIYNSNKKFGVIVYNLSNLKKEEIILSDTKKEDLANFLVASASCFPAFRTKKINDKTYIDGGYVNDMPVDLAIKLGATDIVAINIGIGKVSYKLPSDVNLKVISPKNDLENFLNFDKKISRRVLKLGYNDTLKEYNKLEGDKFSFKLGTSKKLLKSKDRFNLEIKNILGSSLAYNSFLELDDESFLSLIEEASLIMGLRDEVIYNKLLLNFQLKRHLKKVDMEINIKKLIKEHKVVLKNKIVKYLYKLMVSNKKSDLRKLSIIFKKEFLVALYLYIL